MFQPDVSIQTSILILERKSEEEMRLEQAAGDFNDYEVFLAVANHIGHDKRGNKTYVRDAKGNERVETAQREVIDWEDGQRVIKIENLQRKIEDDNTLQIAAAFRRHLKEHDLG